MVVWRGERIGFPSLPERIARLDDRMAREQAYAAYGEALDALSPLYEARLAAWREAGDVRALAAKEGTDPVAMAADLERLSFNIETPYFAALRRYLALIGIEQGDAVEADLWYIERGSSWSSWFGPREVRRALGCRTARTVRGRRPRRMASRRRPAPRRTRATSSAPRSSEPRTQP